MKHSELTEPLIAGIQQIGIGNTAVYETWEWYRKTFGMDVPVFDEAAEAELMLPYTEGEPRSRHAILALNMMGGGGAEIWQYTSKVGQPAAFKVQAGDLGIYIAKFKAKDVRRSHEIIGKDNQVSEITQTPEGNPHFYLSDPFGNMIEVVEGQDWFGKNYFHTGGIQGTVMGVSDMERSIEFYKDILGFDQVVYDETAVFEDFKFFHNKEEKFRRVLLRHSKKRSGPFSGLLGSSEIELIQTLEREPRKIFKDRMWGDLGYIHLCFDVVGMDLLRKKCKDAGCAFTVDSGDFDMGEAAGQFAYIEDPDGTLIEFVQALKVPILKKLNFYLDLRKREADKKLPAWMLKTMRLSRKKD